MTTYYGSSPKFRRAETVCGGIFNGDFMYKYFLLFKSYDREVFIFNFFGYSTQHWPSICVI